jgi:hypothetical protein
MSELGFTTWLRRQRQRDDPVGDLAREAARDRGWPRPPARLAILHAHLERTHAPDGAHEALDRAWFEWDRWRPAT